MLAEEDFELKNNNTLYTRCKSCRDSHNKSYTKKLESFASYDGKTPSGKLKVECWDYDKNGMRPEDVSKCSNKKYWFKCDACNHPFDKSLNHVSWDGRWCPYCSIPPQKLCDNIGCSSCLEKSFASFDGITPNGKRKVECWDYDKNGLITPRKVFKSSGKKYEFKCDACEHPFDSILRNITINNQRWCPYCGKKKLCDDEHCSSCFNKSFASYDGKTPSGKLKVECWDYDKNGHIIPRKVFKSSHKKCRFKCDACNNPFDSRLYSISSGSWCPNCIHKTELILYTFLKELFPDVIQQYSPEWCRNPRTGYLLKYDFFIPSLNLIIELDGDQHFKKVSNWESPDKIQEKDIFKMEKAKEKGISVIRLLQMEILMDTFDWKSHLMNHCVHHDIPEIVLICESGEYPTFLPETNDISNLDFDDEDVESPSSMDDIDEESTIYNDDFSTEENIVESSTE
jgi:hypothetical protein